MGTLSLLVMVGLAAGPVESADPSSSSPRQVAASPVADTIVVSGGRLWLQIERSSLGRVLQEIGRAAEIQTLLVEPALNERAFRGRALATSSAKQPASQSRLNDVDQLERATAAPEPETTDPAEQAATLEAFVRALSPPPAAEEDDRKVKRGPSGGPRTLE
jgi:hypothetical protein